MPETNLQPHFRNYNPREPFPNFQKPHIIDGFSLEQDRTLSEQPRKYLQFWRRPKPGTFDFDLNLGYESYVPGPKETNINSLLKYYQRAGKRNASLFKDSRLAGDFVCYRGLLTQICITPYSTRDPWSVVAIKFRGTIYLCNYESPEKKKAKEASESEYSRKCAFYGKNFERFVMTGIRNDLLISWTTYHYDPFNSRRSICKDNSIAHWTFERYRRVQCDSVHKTRRISNSLCS